MAPSKSFTSRRPTEGASFDINGKVFRLKPSVPGVVMLDFIVGADSENPAQMARTITGLYEAAIIPEDLEAFKEYIANPDNDVDLNMLSEIAGFISEKLSGNGQEPAPYGPG